MNVKKGRKRRWSGWVCLVVAVLSGAAWVWAGATPFDLGTSWGEAHAYHGNLWIKTGTREERKALVQWDIAGMPASGGFGSAGISAIYDVSSLSDLQWTGSPWSWRRPHPQLCPYQVHTVVVPLWPLVLAAVVGAAACWFPWGRGVPGRRRWTAGVAAIAVGLGIVALGVWSGWGGVYPNLAPLSVSSTRGLLRVDMPIDFSDRVGFWLRMRLPNYVVSYPSWAWWEWDWRTTSGKKFAGLTAPLWPLVVVTGALGGTLMVLGGRARRRASTGACGGCGYDLRGLGESVVCPECGRGTT